MKTGGIRGTEAEGTERPMEQGNLGDRGPENRDGPGEAWETESRMTKRNEGMRMVQGLEGEQGETGTQRADGDGGPGAEGDVVLRGPGRDRARG